MGFTVNAASKLTNPVMRAVYSMIRSNGRTFSTNAPISEASTKAEEIVVRKLDEMIAAEKDAYKPTPKRVAFIGAVFITSFAIGGSISYRLIELLEKKPKPIKLPMGWHLTEITKTAKK